MALSNMQVFNQFYMPAVIETLAQRIDAFNGASNGAIQLSMDGFTGDFLQRSFFAGIGGARRRVDRYASNAAVTPVDLSQLKTSAVKIAGGIGPVRYEPSQMTWLQKPTSEGIELVSSQIADLILQDELNTAIAALCAALANQAAATNDVSATAGISQAALNMGHAKFGDASGQIVAHVMSGAVYHKLIGQNLANAQQLFLAQNVRIVDVLGRAVIVTDAPALYVAGTPNKQRVLALVNSAAVVTDARDMTSNIDTTNGKERIETTLQVDYAFGLSLKGYTWDEANGGKSPTDAELATGSNWDKVVTDIKQTAGVIVIGDEAKN